MALQILPQGESFGEAFGSQLGSGLQNIINLKMNQLMQQQQAAQAAKGLGALLPGVAPEQLQAIASSPDLMQYAVPKLIGAQAQEPHNKAFFELAKAMYPDITKSLSEGELSGITPKEFEMLTAMGAQREKIAEQKAKTQEVITNKKQQQVNTANKPYLSLLDKAQPLAEDLMAAANEMEQLLDTGKVASGISGYIPNVLQNVETQRFNALAADVVSKLAAQSGVATRMKIQLAEASKPSTKQKPETQRALIQDLKEKANRVLKRTEIRDRLIAENNGEQPANLETKINKEYQRFEKTGSNLKFGKSFNKLPAASEYKNKKLFDEDSGKTYMSDGKQWKVV